MLISLLFSLLQIYNIFFESKAGGNTFSFWMLIIGQVFASLGLNQKWPENRTSNFEIGKDHIHNLYPLNQCQEALRDHSENDVQAKRVRNVSDVVIDFK